jgi:(E)-2-((N-methylformamido)methylene)succinate hydrolase
LTRSTAGTCHDLTGPPGAQVLVLVHGLGLTRATWDAFVPVLAQEYRVLTYDLSGHGESAKPLQRPSLTVLSNQLLALLDELGIARAAIIGFSLGGMINRRFALDHPERVLALVILNSPHEREPEAQRLVEERAAQTSAGGPAATIDSTLERWFTPQFRKDATDVVAKIRAWVLANDPDNYTKHRQVLANGVVELIRPKPPITAPTLVMTCEHDSGSTPSMSLAIASEIDGAKP